VVRSPGSGMILGASPAFLPPDFEPFVTIKSGVREGQGRHDAFRKSSPGFLQPNLIRGDGVNTRRPDGIGGAGRSVPGLLDGRGGGSTAWLPLSGLLFL